MTRLLAPYAASVTALDLTPGMLSEAKKAVESHDGPDIARRIEWVHGNARAMPFADNSFDLVVSRFALHHWSDPSAILSEMSRVVKPGPSGGVVIVDIVNPKQYAYYKAVTDKLNHLER